MVTHRLLTGLFGGNDPSGTRSVKIFTVVTINCGPEAKIIRCALQGSTTEFTKVGFSRGEIPETLPDWLENYR